MAAPTEIYVDPAINANSGAGTLGDPYGDLQYALDTATRDATNGNRFNVKSGTDEILSATLSFATYGTPTPDTPLIIQGYTSAAGDGGKGGIDGGGSVQIAGALAYLYFVDMHLHNTGTQPIVSLSGHQRLIGCELSDSTAATSLLVSSFSSLLNCYLHDISGRVEVGSNSEARYNYFANGATKKFVRCIDVGNAGSTISHNIFSIDAASVAIFIRERSTSVWNNSIFCAGGTGKGIHLFGASADGAVVLNNLVEGFSGSGGNGITIDSGSRIGVYANNALFGNASDFVGEVPSLDLGGNESLSASPFAKAGSDTFANRFAYFAPVDVGNVRAGAYPAGSHLSKGAVQVAGGTGTTGFTGVRGVNRRLGT